MEVGDGVVEDNNLASISFFTMQPALLVLLLLELGQRPQLGL